MICAGIDAGSRTVKVALLKADSGEVVGSGVIDQGVQQGDTARELYRDVLTGCGASDAEVAAVVATGYGRQAIEFADRTVTEISCHACGVRHLHPEARAVIDIGGQDSKLIQLDADGAVADFAMNDRCAAGTGRFLEVVSTRLSVPLTGLGRLAGMSRAPAAISSMCVVFAETEIIGLLARGTSAEDVVAGVLRSIARRVGAMAPRRLQDPVLFTGGVALVPGMAEALSEALGHEVRKADDPQLTGALGAALIARRGLDHAY